MRRIAKLPSALALAAVLAGGASLLAQVNTTVVLKNGQRHTGNNLAYRVDNRQVVLRTSPAEEPRIKLPLSTLVAHRIHRTSISRVQWKQSCFAMDRSSEDRSSS